VEHRVFSGLGCFFQRYDLARGEVIARHNHEVDHLTIVAAGRAIARTDERSLERGPADAPILFRAGRFHEIEALEDGTVVLNVFSGEMVS
jgi:quercetin dioxygenase-like cupin family protein